MVPNIHYSMYARVCCVKASRAVDASTRLGATDNTVALSYLPDRLSDTVYILVTTSYRWLGTVVLGSWLISQWAAIVFRNAAILLPYYVFFTRRLRNLWRKPTLRRKCYKIISRWVFPGWKWWTKMPFVVILTFVTYSLVIGLIAAYTCSCWGRDGMLCRLQACSNVTQPGQDWHQHTAAAAPEISEGWRHGCATACPSLGWTLLLSATCIKMYWMALTSRN